MESSISHSIEGSTEGRRPPKQNNTSSSHHHHKPHKFSPEELIVLEQSFDILSLEQKIDVTKVAVVLHTLHSTFDDHVLHGLISRASVQNGLIIKEEYLNILAKAWSSKWVVNDLIAKINEVKEGTGFYPALKNFFPSAIPESEFVEKVTTSLHALGFVKHHSIACVCLCRDEICKPLLKLLLHSWGETFEFSSLAGMLFVGRTGMSAALHHAPQVHGRERYVFFSMPHIAVDEFGKIGAIYRPGRNKQSSACGALSAFKAEYDSGHVNMTLDNDDVEYSLMKQNLLKSMEYGAKPSLVDLTKIVQKVTQADLERLISSCVNTEVADYAVISGVQIHGPHWIKHKDFDYVWPVSMYAVVKGVRLEVVL